MQITSEVEWGRSGEHLLLGTLRRSQPSVNPAAIVLERLGQGQRKDNNAFYTWDSLRSD